MIKRPLLVTLYSIIMHSEWTSHELPLTSDPDT